MFFLSNYKFVTYILLILKIVRKTISVVLIMNLILLSVHTGQCPSLYFRFCWLIAAPALLLALWVASLVDYTPPSYRQYQYPTWAQVLGWIIASLSLLCIPVYAIVVIIRSPGNSLREVRQFFIQYLILD